MQNDLNLYERHADQWWQPESPAFRSLHRVNEYRFDLLREWVKDLSGRNVVDLGCGGGLLSEKLARSGARVLGVDLSFASVKTAARHRDVSLSCGYVQGEIRRAPIASACADLVLLADVIEHVVDYPQALKEAARIARPGALVFVNTLNRTLHSRVFAVMIAERLGLIPKGTHNPDMLVRPEELEHHAEEAGLSLIRLQGEAPSLWTTLQRRSIHLRKVCHCRLAYSALLQKAS